MIALAALPAWRWRRRQHDRRRARVDGRDDLSLPVEHREIRDRVTFSHLGRRRVSRLHDDLVHGREAELPLHEDLEGEAFAQPREPLGDRLECPAALAIHDTPALPSHRRRVVTDVSTEVLEVPIERVDDLAGGIEPDPRILLLLPRDPGPVVAAVKRGPSELDEHRAIGLHRAEPPPLPKHDAPTTGVDEPCPRLDPPLRRGDLQDAGVGRRSRRALRERRSGGGSSRAARRPPSSCPPASRTRSQRVASALAKVARTDATVLLIGRAARARRSPPAPCTHRARAPTGPS